MRPRPSMLALALASALLAACGGRGGDAAADSAAIPNTAFDSTGKSGPVGDSLSGEAPVVAAPGTATPTGPDSARPDSAGGRPTGGATTRPD